MQDHHDQYTNNVAFKKVMKCAINIITEIEKLTHEVHNVL